MNVYQGDPKLFMDKDGSYLKFVGGQPVMDQGIENMASISFFTDENWFGNAFLPDKNKIGSDFETVAAKSITLSSLEDTRRAAENALSNYAFGTKTAEITNPLYYRLDVSILIEPPGKDSGVLNLEKNGENWLFQKLDPAYRRE